jgi:hypothetical protein
MTSSDYEQLISDPEAEGLPGSADDDSFADPEHPASRVADGPDPAALPADRPIASTDFGTTAEEQRQGESLDGRLRRENPDPALDEPSPDSRQELSDAIDELPPGSEDPADPRLAGILEAEDPALDSKVSVYERLGGDAPAGRLVAPDEGAHPDAEAEAFAEDRGVAGGGLSAEEAAIREDR